MRNAYYLTAEKTWKRFTEACPNPTELRKDDAPGALPRTVLEGVSVDNDEYALKNESWCGIVSFVDLDASTPETFLHAAVPFVNDKCWGTLSTNILIDPNAEMQLGAEFDRAIAELRYGGIAINCWTGFNYGLVHATWGALPGHRLDDVQSRQGVVHNGLLLDHPEKGEVRAPFTMNPTPAWFTDHRNDRALVQALTAFEEEPGLRRLASVLFAALKG